MSFIYKRFNTLRLHITLLMAIASVVSITVVGSFTIISTRNQLKQETASRLTDQVLLQSNVLETQLAEIRNTAHFLESALMAEIAHTHQLDSLSMLKIKSRLESSLREWGHLAKPFSMWIVFNSDVIRGQHTVSFYDENHDGVYIREKEYAISEQNLTTPEFDWWTMAIEKGEVWTSPYYWQQWNKTLITYSKAVYHNGKLIACLGSDFDFSNFKTNLQAYKIYSNGYLMLIDQDQNLLVHPNHSNKSIKELLPMATINELYLETTQKPFGFIKHPLLQKERFLAYSKLSNNWVLAASAPKREVFRPLDTLLYSILFFLSLAIVVSILIGYFLGRTLQKKVLDLVYLFERSSKGELYHRWNKHHLKEINMIGAHFNKFMDQMQTMVGHLNNQQFLLKKALKRANESDELKSAFLGNLSHEIRTPLYAITGFASLLDSCELSKDEKENFINIINKNSDKLLKFFDNILVFSKLEQNQLHLSKSDTLPSQLLEEIQISSQSLYRSDNKALKWDNCAQSNGKSVDIDSTLFKIAAEALIDNAWKFTHSGSIEIGCFTNESDFVFFVDDPGIGVPAQFHDLIFKKFFKYKDINNDVIFDGVGMGLSIAKGIIDLHKGHITIKSKPEGGTRFEVYIPLKQ